MKQYIVQKGDTLSKIAKKYGTTVNKIVSANSALIDNPNDIRVGWKLSIPADNESIRNTLEKLFDDIEKLPSYQQLMEIL